MRRAKGWQRARARALALPLIAAAGVAGLGSSPRASAGADFWNAGDGNWSDPANWSSGVPGVSSDAYIVQNDAVARTISYDFIGTAITLKSLALDNTGGGTNILTQAANSLSATTQFIGSNGAGIFNQSGGSNNAVNLYLGYSGSGFGTYSLSDGALGVTGIEAVGSNGAGVFNQTGGTHTVSVGANRPSFYVGYSNGNGAYNLIGGSLTVAAQEAIGSGGSGIFSQSGGVHTVTGARTNNVALYIGHNGGSGTYNLSGGLLTLPAIAGGSGGPDRIECVGSNGTGVFIQTGGTNAVSGNFAADLYVGYGGSGRGTYNLIDGLLTVTATGSSQEFGNVIVGLFGTGAFNQSGGIHLIGATSGGGQLLVGFGKGGSGTYSLSSGVLAVQGGNEFIGSGTVASPGGSGTFNQSGGTHTVSKSGPGSLTSGELDVGNRAGSGTYNLSGGSLAVDNYLFVGGSANGGNLTGTGVFNQTGGTLSTGSWLSVGNGSGTSTGVGTYNLSGGTVNIGSDLNIADMGNCTGTFNMTNGAVFASDIWVSSKFGDGVASGLLTQTGGMITLSGPTGVQIVAGGTCQLLGGALVSSGTGVLKLAANSSALFVGTNATVSGFGPFNQAGGVATIPGTLTIDPSGTAAVSSYNFTGGTATIGALAGTNGSVVVGSTAAASIASLGVGRFALGSLRVETSGAVTVGGGGPRVSNSAGSLTINGNGTLDLADGSLLTSTAADTIKSYLARAYTANGDWSGPGLTSALARGNPVKYSLAYASGSDQSAQDAGIAVAAGQVLVTPTLSGDANLDGRVDFFDIAQLLGYKYNTGQAASYTDGDLNYDGVVDFFDLTVVLSANYNSGEVFGAAATASAGEGAGTSVPEPVGVGGLVALALAGCSRRRRGRAQCTSIWSRDLAHSIPDLASAFNSGERGASSVA
jgi:hypothetical protein